MPSRASSRRDFSRDPEGFDRPLHHHLIYLHFHQYIRINTMRKYLLSIPMILLLLVGSASAQTVNFSLRGLDGKTYSASDYRGKVLVLAIIGYG